MGLASIEIPVNYNYQWSNVCASLILICTVAFINLGCLKYEIVLSTHKTAECSFITETQTTNVTAREYMVS